MNEPDFLTVEDVLQIHDEQIEIYGGIRGIRDKNLLESALMMPQAGFGGEYLHAVCLKWRRLTLFTLPKINRFLTATNERRSPRVWFFWI